MRTVQTRNGGNRFIEQYKWTIGVCITVQIGERGKFMDVQIAERSKQRVKGVYDDAHDYLKYIFQEISIK